MSNRNTLSTYRLSKYNSNSVFRSLTNRSKTQNLAVNTNFIRLSSQPNICFRKKHNSCDLINRNYLKEIDSNTALLIETNNLIKLPNDHLNCTTGKKEAENKPDIIFPEKKNATKRFKEPEIETIVVKRILSPGPKYKDLQKIGMESKFWKLKKDLNLRNRVRKMLDKCLPENKTDTKIEQNKNANLIIKKLNKKTKNKKSQYKNNIDENIESKESEYLNVYSQIEDINQSYHKDTFNINDNFSFLSSNYKLSNKKSKCENNNEKRNKKKNKKERNENQKTANSNNNESLFFCLKKDQVISPPFTTTSPFNNNNYNSNSQYISNISNYSNMFNHDLKNMLNINNINNVLNEHIINSQIYQANQPQNQNSNLYPRYIQSNNSNSFRNCSNNSLYNDVNYGNSQMISKNNCICGINQCIFFNQNVNNFTYNNYISNICNNNINRIQTALNNPYNAYLPYQNTRSQPNIYNNENYLNGLNNNYKERSLPYYFPN